MNVQRVRPNNSFPALGRNTKRRTVGTILRRKRDNPELVVVQWDGFAAPETVSEEFLELVPKTTRSDAHT